MFWLVFLQTTLEEAIHLTIDLLFEAKPDIKIIRKDLHHLFQFATSQISYLFNRTMYDQVDRDAMGSPLAPTLPNFFMWYHESGWIRNYNYNYTIR